MTDTRTPRVQRLDILVTGGQASLVEAARRAWTEFEGSTRLPFSYEELKCGVCDEAGTSAWADMQVDQDGLATIRVTPQCLDAPFDERQLTLLHESLHIASFVGPLHEMYEAVKQLDQKYWYAFEIAHSLGHYMYEVDAELALAKHYPDLARRRAEYYVTVQERVRLQEREEGGWYSRLPVDDPSRPYYVLGDQLCAELAGVLAGDVNVEIRLCSGLEPVSPESADAIEALRRILSPKNNDYADLSRWGAATYEAVLLQFIDKVQRVK